MKFITSFSRHYLAKYAWRLLDTRQFLPGELIAYSEDGANPPGIEMRALDDPDLLRFKDKLRGFRTNDWRRDVVRFAHKVFAQCDALLKADQPICWIDADCVLLKPLPEAVLLKMLGTAYCAHFERSAFNAPYTETGFLIFDPRKPQNRDFVKAYRDVYLSGRIFALPMWHDCYAFDEARKPFGEFRSLTTDYTVMHPIVVSPLGEYLDHLKGPRKDVGFSEEHPAKWWEGRTVLGTGSRRHYPAPASAAG